MAMAKDDEDLNAREAIRRDRNTREAIRRELCFFVGWDSEHRPSLDETLETIRHMRSLAED